MPGINTEQWKKIREYITAYVDRGGVNEGRNFKLLDGTNLLNEVGVALGLTVSDYTTWSKRDWELAAEGKLCFFRGDQRKVVDSIVDKILEEFDDTSVYLTVIPYAFVTEDQSNPYFLCLFQAKKYSSSATKYFDNAGRVYSTFGDWKENNVLPPGVMAYPYNGILERESDETVDLRYKDTPSASTSATVTKVADITAGVVGLVGGVGAIFATGGLAIPFVVGGLSAAVYGTSRSVYHLIDRGTHGQTINPFTDYTAFTIWLGIGANILSFGAMGATMRLTSLAVRGKTISDGFKLLVNIINGTSFVCNTAALANGLVYTLIHFEDLSPVDLLMQVAAMAFWARSLYSFQTAGTIAKNIRAQAINGYTNGLSGDQKNAFEAVRAQIQNDEALVRLFYESGKNQLDPTHVGVIISDLHQSAASYQIDPKGLTISINGNSFDLKFLTTVSSNDRQVFMNVLGGLNQEQVDIFSRMRGNINNDLKTMYLIAKTSRHFDITPEAATHGLIKFYSYLENSPQTPIRFNNDGILLFSNGQQFTLPQIVRYSGNPNIMNILVREILPLPQQEALYFNQIRTAARDDGQFFNWLEVANRGRSNIVRSLVQLETNTNLPFKFSSLITGFIVNEAISVDIISLNSHVNVSVRFLTSMDSGERNSMLVMIRDNPVVNSVLSKNFNGKRYEIVSEITRRQTETWYRGYITPYEGRIRSFPNLRPHDLNRLNYLKTQLDSVKIPAARTSLTSVAIEMRPSNVTELISYHDFGKSWLDKCKIKYTPKEYNDYRNMVKNQGQGAPMKKAEWAELKAKQELTPAAFREHFELYKQIVRQNDMFSPGMLDVGTGLSAENLVTKVKQNVTNGNQVKFASEITAATHLFKHEHGGDLSGPMTHTKDYVRVANEIICDPRAEAKVSVTQEGVTRIISFQVEGRGKVILLETEAGKVLLCTYIEGSRARGA